MCKRKKIVSGDDDKEKKMKFDRCYGFSCCSSRFAYFFLRPSVERNENNSFLISSPCHSRLNSFFLLFFLLLHLCYDFFLLLQMCGLNFFFLLLKLVLLGNNQMLLREFRFIHPSIIIIIIIMCLFSLLYFILFLPYISFLFSAYTFW